MRDTKSKPPISPPVSRAVSVLNFLAGHPEQAFTLSEISRPLHISGATCHTLLAALVNEGYVFRTVGKTYVLGPALARVAQASLAPGLVMNVARPEMRLLADEYDLICSAYHLVDNRISIFERAVAVSHIHWKGPPPVVLPLAAPTGGVFFAWQADALEQWIAAAEPPLDEEQRRRLRASLESLRERGFGFGVAAGTDADERAGGPSAERRKAADHLVPSLDPAADYRLAYVTAPIFSRPGKVAFGLSLSGFTTMVSGADIAAIGARLRDACDRIGAFVVDRRLNRKD